MTDQHDEESTTADGQSDAPQDTRPESAPKKRRKNSYWRIPAAIALIALLVAGAFYGYVYAASPAVIREPLMEHYHLRMQVLVDGKAEDFSTKAYQEGYSKDQCSGSLADHPFHFHDNRDQMVHVHWEGMTGGLLMKYYGWNYIGGKDNVLGYRLDQSKLKPMAVPIHGKTLPNVPAGDSFYVYTGDENGYKERSFDDWKSQDLEKFFGRTSTFPAHELNQQQRMTSLMDTVFPKAYAHSADEHQTSSADEASPEELKKINNLEGNVVIFVQKNKPTDQQVKDRFDHLVPLEASTCGG